MKVHYASFPMHVDVLSAANVNYCLFSYHFIKKLTPGNKVVQFMNSCKHSILDSGLFSMMFGTENNLKRTEKDIYIYLHNYIEWINSNKLAHSVVELDVQKLFSSDFAWELRKELAKRIKNTVINVYHLEDQNPDKLIDYSDYMAVSIPELRKHRERKELLKIGDYILKKCIQKNKKVHMLGCTEKELLKRWRNAYSCDSTSWVSLCKFGSMSIQSDSLKTLKIGDVKKYCDLGQFKNKLDNSEGAQLLSLKLTQAHYQLIAGDQS